MREISAADHQPPDDRPQCEGASATTSTEHPTSTKKNTATTAMSRRSKKAVRTVPTSDQGRAACSEHPELFEQVEDPERVTHHEDRLLAAAICDGCPMRFRCGFRVFPTGNRPKGDR